jgi:hypothetical protein
MQVSLRLLAGAIVFLATACGANVGSPPTPSSTSVPESTQPPALLAASPALPQPRDLTLAHEAGSILVGLSVRPALPGPNTLLLYVAPLAGPAAGADVPLTLEVDGTNVPLTTCSRSCRSATLNLNGGERVQVQADGSGGGMASFDLPSLPASDGAELLQHVQERMHELHSYRVDETLGPAEPPLKTSYVFQAPDRMQMDLANGSSTIWVGPTRYIRKDPTQAWQAESIGSGPAVPGFEWDPRAGVSATNASIVGRAEVDGVATQALAFFEGTPQTPVWFQLWVDANGLVRDAEMRAQGHFMTHHYADFDASPPVEPPSA